MRRKPRIYAISDIHGCMDTFDKMLNKIGLNTSDSLIIIGDLIDRGPKSREVMEKIIALKEGGYDIHLALGNHEHFLYQSLNRQPDYVWLHPGNGGMATIRSFGKGPDDVFEIEQHHADLLSSANTVLSDDTFVFVHASLDFTLDDPIKETSMMHALWERARYDEYDPERIGNRILVRGHTPTPKVEILEQLGKIAETGKGDVIIDGGCVFNHRLLGKLCCVNLSNFTATFVKNIDK